MAEQLPIQNARITVANVKLWDYQRNDGSAAKRQGIGHKLDSGAWFNLSNFDYGLFPVFVPGNVVDVGYTAKYATNGDGSPKLDKDTGQQRVYNTVQTAVLVSGQMGAEYADAPAQPAATPGAPPAVPGAPPAPPGAAPASAPATVQPQAMGSSDRQVALQCASDFYSRAWAVDTTADFKWELVFETAELFERFLSGKSTEEIDVALGTAPPKPKAPSPPPDDEGPPPYDPMNDPSDDDIGF